MKLSIYSAHDIEKLKKYSYVTGLPIFTSRESFQFTQKQAGKLKKNRRYTAKLVTMFIIHNGGAPSYLNDIIPDKHENISSYNKRNKYNYFIPRCRLELFLKKFCT